MGIPIHPDPEVPVGADCSRCTPDPWWYGKTPGRIRIVFHLVDSCPGFPAFPNEIPFYLYQDTYDHCIWLDYKDFGGETYHFQWAARYSAVTVRITTLANVLAFSAAGPTCLPERLSNACWCTWHASHAGYANILDLPHPMIDYLATELNFQPGLRALYDDSPSGTPGSRCIRMTGRISQGSCLWLYQP